MPPGPCVQGMKVAATAAGFVEYSTPSLMEDFFCCVFHLEGESEDCGGSKHREGAARDRRNPFSRFQV